MSSHDSHSAHASDDYRSGWDRIFGGKKHVECARHKSVEPDMRERCTCAEPERVKVIASKRFVP